MIKIIIYKWSPLLKTPSKIRKKSHCQLAVRHSTVSWYANGHDTPDEIEICEDKIIFRLDSIGIIMMLFCTYTNKKVNLIEGILCRDKFWKIILTGTEWHFGWGWEMKHLPSTSSIFQAALWPTCKICFSKMDWEPLKSLFTHLMVFKQSSLSWLVYWITFFHLPQKSTFCKIHQILQFQNMV